MRSALFIALASLAACSDSGTDGDDQSTGTDPVPLEEGRYRGSYLVPVDDSALEAAATFEMSAVDWEVRDSEITLDYHLPVGLVGGDVHIRMSGSLANAKLARLSSDQGTAECTAVGRVITCKEEFADLGTLPISADVVTQRAATEYKGHAMDRGVVADGFASDPIGIVVFDLDTVGANDPADD